MIIKKATIKDFEKLKEIKTEFFLWECNRDKRQNPNYVKRGLGSRLAKNLRQDNIAFFIAVDKGEVIGYSGAEITKNSPDYVYKKRGHLFNLYVKPKYQNKGIGKRLVRETLKWFKKKKVFDLMIHVFPFNKKAHKIYKKFGFGNYIIILKKVKC